MFSRLLGRDRGDSLAPLYAAVVALARRPDWYRVGRVPDTLDGRFDMVAAVLALVLIRLEAEDPAGREPSARLAERFVDDMDGQLREEGVGDVVVGKHIGRMMAALGGRVGAYRNSLAPGGDLAAALLRNLFRGVDPGADALAWTADAIRSRAKTLAAVPLDRLLAGDLG